MNLLSPLISRRVAFAALVALLALVGLVATSSAMASSAASTEAKGCAKQVVSDWYSHKDKKVHGHYPLHCYQDALDSLGSDVGDYTNAREAISAAAAAEALLCKSNCGPKDPPAGGTKSGVKGIFKHNTYDFGGNPPPDQTIDPIQVNAASPSSVPLPLIVLAALAGVLMLAGGGSYLARRVKASRGAPPVTDP